MPLDHGVPVAASAPAEALQRLQHRTVSWAMTTHCSSSTYQYRARSSSS